MSIVIGCYYLSDAIGLAVSALPEDEYSALTFPEYGGILDG
jgi:hypothetical protein